MVSRMKMLDSQARSSHAKTRRDDAVEADALESGEELVEVDLALPDVEVLVHGDLGPRQVDDVAQAPRRPLWSEKVGDVDHRQQVAALSMIQNESLPGGRCAARSRRTRCRC